MFCVAILNTLEKLFLLFLGRKCCLCHQQVTLFSFFSSYFVLFLFSKQTKMWDILEKA